MPVKTYPITDEMQARVDNNYTHHPPTPDQIERYPLLREKAKELQMLILQLTPPSREQSVASTKLEEAVMWANAAIARNENGDADED